MTDWTPRAERVLTELWAKGLSARQIAEELPGYTRNAVIGKAHRLGLEKRLSPFDPENKRFRSARYQARLDRAANNPRGKMKDRLEANGYIRPLPFIPRGGVYKCQFIEGDPRKREFCNAETVDDHPWCPTHYARVFRAKRPEKGAGPIASDLPSQPDEPLTGHPSNGVPQRHVIASGDGGRV
jgi:hypothetical protein